MQETSELLVEDTGDGVRIVTMNRPERLNALSPGVRRGMREAFADAENGDRIRAIVLRGAGGRAFSVGADLKEPTTHASEEIGQSFSMFVSGEVIMPECRLPVIAAVQGLCCGGGWEVALACDLLLCTEDAQFWHPQTGLGLFPGAGGTSRLVKIVGKPRAMDIVLTGRRVSGREAQQLGIASRLFADGEALMDGARALAIEIAHKAPLGVALAKQSILRGVDLPLAQAMREDGMTLFPLYGSNDRKEASAAFLERRQPLWTGS